MLAVDVGFQSSGVVRENARGPRLSRLDAMFAHPAHVFYFDSVFFDVEHSAFYLGLHKGR